MLSSVNFCETFRRISAVWENAPTYNLDKCLLYSFSIGSQFLDFIRCREWFSTGASIYFFYCVTVKTSYLQVEFRLNCKQHLTFHQGPLKKWDYVCRCCLVLFACFVRSVKHDKLGFRTLCENVHSSSHNISSFWLCLRLINVWEHIKSLDENLWIQQK